MYPENPEGTQIIVGSMNMGYISNTARNRTHNLFRPKREPIPLGHSNLCVVSGVVRKYTMLSFIWKIVVVVVVVHENAFES